MTNIEYTLITFGATFAGVFLSFILWFGSRYLIRRHQEKEIRRSLIPSIQEEMQFNIAILASTEGHIQNALGGGDVPLFIPRLNHSASSYAISSGEVRVLSSIRKRQIVGLNALACEAYNEFANNTERILTTLLLRQDGMTWVRYRLERFLVHVKQTKSIFEEYLAKLQRTDLHEVEEGTVMNDEDKEAKVERRWWSGLWGQLLVGLGQLFFGVVLTGMVLYVVAQYKMGSFEPFQLATVVGLLGGFPLVAAFGEKMEDGMRKKLRIIAGLYLFAAICLVVFGFYQAADQAKLVPSSGFGSGIFKVVYVGTFYGGGIAFIFGMWMTLLVIPELIGLGDIKERAIKIFRKRK